MQRPRHALDGHGGTWSELPGEIVQILGQHMDVPEWVAARGVCKQWAAHITAGITQLEMDTEPNAHRAHMVLTCIARLFPRLSSVVLLLSSRLTSAVFAERVMGLAVAVHVKDLELRSMTSHKPRLGSVLADTPSAVTSLLHLTSLRISSGPTPAPQSLQALASLRNLQSLELLPGDYGCVGMELGPGGVPSEHPQFYGVVNVHAEALGALTSLTRLMVKVKPRHFTAHGLQALTTLSKLEMLVLYDTDLPSSSLSAITALSALTDLQIGLSDCDDLQPLAQLPALQNLYLEATDIPDIRQFVAAASALRLPPAAKLNGLYLVDQVLTSAEHVSCLVSLPDLHDLLLENPKVPDGASVTFDLQVLTALKHLQIYQIDKAPGNGLSVMATPSALHAIGACCTALSSLDLYNLQPAEFPAASIAALSAITTLQSLSLNACPPGSQGAAEFGLLRRHGSLWHFPPGLQQLNIACFDFREDRGRGREALTELIPRFSQLQHLRLHACYVPNGLIGTCLTPKLVTLDCKDVEGVAAEELSILSTLTGLSSLCWENRAVGLGSLRRLKPARMLKKLQCRLEHMAMDSHTELTELSGLQILSLECAFNHTGTGPAPHVRSALKRVETAVKAMPFCDVELRKADEEHHEWPEAWEESQTVQRWDAQAWGGAVLASDSEDEDEAEEQEQQPGQQQGQQPAQQPAQQQQEGEEGGQQQAELQLMLAGYLDALAGDMMNQAGPGL